MNELPMEISSRISIFSKILHNEHGLDTNSEEDMKIATGIILLNKIVYYFNNPSSSSTFKVDNLEEFNKILDKKWENREVFSIYSAFTSPIIYGNTGPSRLLMVRGNFIKVKDNFELKDIIDRDKQINTIIDSI